MTRASGLSQVSWTVVLSCSVLFRCGKLGFWCGGWLLLTSAQLGFSFLGFRSLSNAEEVVGGVRWEVRKRGEGEVSESCPTLEIRLKVFGEPDGSTEGVFWDSTLSNTERMWKCGDGEREGVVSEELLLPET